MWNMQSGMKRKTFDVGPRPPDVAARFQSSEKERSVNGLATDSLNRVVIASTFDGTINVMCNRHAPSVCQVLTLSVQFFDFHTKALNHTLVLPSNTTSILLHRDSGLLAVVCDDLMVRVVDIETRKVVREMGGFRGRVLDVVCKPLFS